MRIAYLATVWDPSDLRDKMGVAHFIVRGLKQLGHEVTVIDLRKKHIVSTYFFKVLSRLVPGRPYMWPSYMKRVNRIYELATAEADYDMLFAFGSLPFAYLRYGAAKICWTDATFPLLYGRHINAMQWPQKFVRAGFDIDRRALQNCDRAIFCSEWARSSAVRDLSIDREKTEVIPFGGNIPSEPSLQEISLAVEERLESETVELVFMAVAWESKGGPMLFDMCREIKKKGRKAELHIIGVKPEVPADLTGDVLLHGFLSKKNDEDFAKLGDIMIRSHFFVMLSQGDTYGHVYCEANAFGLPVIGYDVAGAGEIIEDEKNGMSFPIETKGVEITNYIVNTISSKEKYRQLALHSREEYEKRLSWQAAYKLLDDVLKEFD